jgi:hypothetical protein
VRPVVLVMVVDGPVFQPQRTGSLGSNREFASIPSRTAQNEGDFERASRRVLRYILQSAAAELLKGAGKGGKGAGVCYCLRSVKDKKLGVQVFHSAKHGSAHYGNLMICGLNWVCPVCAVKIASRRVVEVERAVQVVQEYGGSVGFLTLTVPHYFRQVVGPLVCDFLAAVRAFKSHRRYIELMGRVDHLGEIRSLEVTYGENGWHPHTHSLHFFDSRYVSFEGVEDELKALWASVVARCGLGASHGVYGLTFQEVGGAGEDAAAVAAYAVKSGEALEASTWGPSDELVRGNTKQARRGGRTPFALLADYALVEDAEAGQLFKSYAGAFKGKNHLRWSKGLRENLSLSWVVLSDQELAEQQTEEADQLGVLTHAEWRRVLCAGRAARGELLEVASAGDWSRVVEFVRGLS